MENKKMPLDLQPFGTSEGVTGPDKLVDGVWRFYRRNAANEQRYIDIETPPELRRANLRVTPYLLDGIWYWSVVDTTTIKSRRGA